MKRLIVIGCIVFAPLIAHAQVASEQQLEVQGLGISPFLIETTVEPGKEQLQHIMLSNTTASPLPIAVSINDFVPSGVHGQASFLASEQTSDPKFSLSNWIRIVEQPSFTIPAHGQTEVVFSITPPADAEPGTHYGGLLFSYQPSIPTTSSIAVTQKAGVLVLAKLGQANEQGAITDFTAESNLNHSLITFLVSFYNQGNVHVKPKGEIYIQNMFGHEIASLPINRDATIVLPESQRNFQGSWTTGWRFGRYTAVAVLYFGNPKLEIRREVGFWIIPWQRLCLVVGSLLVLFMVGRYAIQRYNAWLIKG